MRISGSVDHSRRARLTGAASRGSIWKTVGVSAAATYTNSHPTRTRRMTMTPVCSLQCFGRTTRLRSPPSVRELLECRHGPPRGRAGDRGAADDRAAAPAAGALLPPDPDDPPGPVLGAQPVAAAAS